MWKVASVLVFVAAFVVWGFDSPASCLASEGQSGEQLKTALPPETIEKLFAHMAEGLAAEVRPARRRPGVSSTRTASAPAATPAPSRRPVPRVGLVVETGGRFVDEQQFGIAHQ